MTVVFHFGPKTSGCVLKLALERLLTEVLSGLETPKAFGISGKPSSVTKCFRQAACVGGARLALQEGKMSP